MIAYPKRLIEVDLPIKRISAHSRREKSIRHGHISTLHIWWARRPLAACRAVICAALWPDPADELCPPAFREAAADAIHEFAQVAVQDKSVGDICSEISWGRWVTLTKPENRIAVENPDHLSVLRASLLDFIGDFAAWKASTQPDFLKTARTLTQAAHEALGGEPGTRPLVVDPFAGGGSIPLEALRVGADAFASDLNPVAVLLCKVVLEYIPKYGQRLADEVRKWGEWIKKEAEKELAEFYPKDPDGATPIAYLWARTITCEGPGCGAEVPLMRSLWLAKKSNRSMALKMVPDHAKKRVDFQIIEKVKASDVGDGTIRRGSATCPICGFTTPVSRIREQLKERWGGAKDARLFTVVTTKPGQKGKFFRLPTEQDLKDVRAAADALERKKKDHTETLSFVPDEPLPPIGTLGFRVQRYGMMEWGDLFTSRQALALGTIASLITDSDVTTGDQEKEDREFNRAIVACLGLAIGRCCDYWSSLVIWAGDFVAHTFGRQALPIVWDFAEVFPFSESTGDWGGAIEWICRVVDREAEFSNNIGETQIANAFEHPLPDDSVQTFITDPPYYDAVPYADLADFFYVWLRRALTNTHPELFDGDLTPKDDECIVDESKSKDKTYFEATMGKALAEGRRVLAPDGVGMVVFAHKSTSGWEAQLQAMIDAGWVVTGSWPIDTERPGRLRAQGSAALASSIHIVCRPRENPDGLLREEIGDWRDVLAELPKRIHDWMPRLAQEGVVGADAIFSCLGPALEIFSRYSRVEKASGEQVELKEYLEQVWAAVAKEALSMIFKGADATGFEQDARLTAMYLWTLFADKTGGNGESEEEEHKTKSTGYSLEYDAARKIAQGIGAHLEHLTSVVEVKGDTARLIPVAERTKALFSKDEADAPTTRRRRKKQMELGFVAELEEAEESGAWGKKGVPSLGSTVLDRLHQAMILFAAGRGADLKRFLVDEGAGRDDRFWRLADSLVALYPAGSEERRWVEGVLGRKKSLGF